jgi:predicted aspartyl protease
LAAPPGQSQQAAQAPAAAKEAQGEAETKTAQPGATSEDLALADVLAKVFLAYGGKEALAQLDKQHTFVGEQTTLSEASDGQPVGGSKTPFRQLRRGASLRIDVESGGEPSATVYDGVSGWKASGKIVSELSADMTKILAKQRSREPWVFSRYEDLQFNFKLVGRTTYRATPVWGVEVDDGSVKTTFFIDQRNYQIIGSSYTTADPETKAQVAVATDFQEYRPAAGTLIPFKQVQYVNEKPVFEIAFSSVDVRKEPDEINFRRPDRLDEIVLEKSVTLPFAYSHKAVLVKVRINHGDPLDFLLDTGASQTIIDRRVAAEYLLDRQGNYSIGTANGVVITEKSVIKTLEMGEISLNDMQILMLDLTAQSRQLGQRVAGIIGNNIMSLFAVEINYPKSTVTLHDASSYKPPPGSATIPFAHKQGPVVKATLGINQPLDLLIDTGAAFNNLPTKVAKKFAAMQTPHTIEGTGLDGRPVKLGTVVVDTVKLGPQIVRKVPFTFSVDQEQRTERRGFFQAADLGILGNPFWQNFVITLDYKFQRLVLRTSQAFTARQEIDQWISQADDKLVIHRDLRLSEALYQKALIRSEAIGDAKLQARVWGRLGNVRRVMAKDLNRPEQAHVAYEYYSKAQALAHKLVDREGEGRILGDWSLLYMDNNQLPAARQALDGALLFAPQDPQINVNFAVYLYKTHAYADMNRYIDRALFLDPSNWQALWYKVKLAEMFSDQGQLKTALKEILRCYPWSTMARDKLAQATQPPRGLPPGANLPPGSSPNPQPGAMPPGVVP